MQEIQQRTGINKLAETLKRCGIASSIHDAHRIASDISTTEKKCQTFYEKKKEEIKSDHYLRTHPRRSEETSKSQESSNTNSPGVNYRQANFQDMLNRVKDPKPINIQCEFQTPKNESIKENKPLEQVSPINIKEYDHNENILQSNVPISNMNQPETQTKGDFINNYMDNQPIIKSNEKEIVSNIEINNNVTIEKEDVQSYENQTSRHEPSLVQENIISEPVQSINITEPSNITEPIKAEEPVVEEKKTDDNPKIDIHDYFNYSKRNMSGAEKLSKPNVQPTQTESSRPQQTESHSAIKMDSNASSHPKTGQSASIDIHDFFNFSKRK